MTFAHPFVPGVSASVDVCRSPNSVEAGEREDGGEVLSSPSLSSGHRPEEAWEEAWEGSVNTPAYCPRALCQGQPHCLYWG